MSEFITVLTHYLIEILPALAIGFFLSGLVHEFVPGDLVERTLGKKGIAAVFWATVIGTLLPICCWGSLPLAISFYKKGSRLGPVLAFLVATPATSISALLVTYKLLGPAFTIFIFFAVIVMGVAMGMIGNNIHVAPGKKNGATCSQCGGTGAHTHATTLAGHFRSVVRFAFWDMPRELGLELIIGILLAAIVATVVPVGLWIRNNLTGAIGYGFALVFGLVMYICSTATVPLVDAFMSQGLPGGAGMVLLLAGPVTSYGTVLVLKKEFGLTIVTMYLVFISLASLGMGYLFSLI